jgi:hypothetical protein
VTLNSLHGDLYICPTPKLIFILSLTCGTLGLQMVRRATFKLRTLGCLKVHLQIRDNNQALVAFY